VVEHPLNLANPERHPRQFGGKGVDLDADDVLRPNRRELAGQAQGLGLGSDLMLQVFQAQQGEEQEVARPTGGVQHPELLQAVEPHPLDYVSHQKRQGSELHSSHVITAPKPPPPSPPHSAGPHRSDGHPLRGLAHALTRITTTSLA